MKNIDWCIDYLRRVNDINQKINLPKDRELRALMNITMPNNLSDEFYIKQDYAIKEIYDGKVVVDVKDITPIKNKIYLYKGDITLIKADAIVNACNEKLLGCFHPLHNCIDNAIHSFAGLEVRRDLINIMKEQGKTEENGKCKVTNAYNLPSNYIFHTVGPKVYGNVTKENEIDLENCYLSCLKKANEMNIKSIVFPCISTGIYGYPKEEAATLAYSTIKKYLEDNPNTSINKIVFNVFTEEDYEYYKRIIIKND